MRARTFPATCRCCACRTSAPTSRRRPASCSIGFFEPKGKPLPDDKIPDDSEFLNLPDDWDHLARELELAVRAPADPEAHRPAHLLQRPGELHARRPLDPRRGARPCAISSSPPASIRSASRPPAASARRSRNGWRPASRRFDLTSLRHPPLPALPRQRDLPRRPHRRGARPALRRPVPLSQPRERARRAHHAAARAARRARRLLHAKRPAGSAPPGSCPRPRAPAARRPSTATAGGGRPGSTMSPRSTRPCARASASSTSRLRQDPRRGPRRGGRAAAHLRQRCRRGAGPHRLYAVAQPQRRRGGRPHGCRACRATCSWS